MRTLALCTLLMLAGCGPKTPPPAKVPPPPALVATTPGPPGVLRVSHAWVKDSPDPTMQAAQRQAMDSLRGKVANGESFDAGFASLGVDPGPWHVATDETYPYEVVPVDARDLPVGTVSAVIVGDGGLHLFRIIQRPPEQ